MALPGGVRVRKRRGLVRVRKRRGLVRVRTAADPAQNLRRAVSYVSTVQVEVARCLSPSRGGSPLSAQRAQHGRHRFRPRAFRPSCSLRQRFSSRPRHHGRYSCRQSVPSLRRPCRLTIAVARSIRLCRALGRPDHPASKPFISTPPSLPQTHRSAGC